MSRPRPLEVRALIPLLEDDWPDAESLAVSLIQALDRVRASRTSYIGVMQFGSDRPWYMGMGPFPGARSAEAAVVKHPGRGLAAAVAVVPVMSPEGLEEHLKTIG